MTNCDRPPEAGDQQRLENLAAACDEALTRGEDPTPLLAQPSGLSAENQQQLAETVACLRALHELLPAGKAAPPRRFGKFRLERLLGQGGFGLVWLAEDPLLHRKVALKVPRLHALAAPESADRFLREARAAASLEHPHLVPVFEIGSVDGIGYLATAYCEGPSLAEWLRRSPAPTPLRAAAHLVELLARAAAHMHERGVWHRDLKPSNVLLFPKASADSKGATDPKGSRGLGGDNNSLDDYDPKIADFGLARQRDARVDATRSGTVLGTPAYMAPEQAEGRLDRIGPATDVHALGVVLYELLAGRPPYRGATDVATLQQVVHDEPLPLRRQRPDVPRDLETICLKCLAKAPAERYGSAADLGADLRSFLEGRPTAARPLPAWQRGVKWARRRPLAAALAAAVSLALAGLIVGSLWYGIQQERHSTELTRINAELSATAKREHDQRTLAEQRERQLLLRSYTDRFDGALEAWKQGRLLQAVQRLDELLPAQGGQDLRGFEWYYLKRLCHPLHAVWRGHFGGVTCVAVSPDRTLLASGSTDRTVRLWDIATGQVRAVLPGHVAEVRSIAFSPDGRTLASAADFGRSELILWDVVTGKARAKAELTPAGNVRVAFAPDGATVAVTNLHGFGLWDAVTGQQRVYYPVDGFNILSAAFAPDRRTLATGNNDFCIRLWDVTTGKERSRLRGHSHLAWSVAFSPDGRTLASGGHDHTVRLWDLATTQQIAELRPRYSHVGCVAFSHDGRTLASASQGSPGEHALSLWDLAGRSLVATYDAQLGNVVGSLAFLPDSPLLAFDGGEKTVRWLDTGPPPASRQLTGHAPHETWSVAFAPDGRTLASAGDDHHVRLWDMATGRQRALLQGHESLVTALAFSRDTTLASASYDGTVRLWDAATEKLGTTLDAHGAKLRCLALSPDGKLVAAGTRTQGAAEVRLWERRTGRSLPPLTGHQKTVRCVAYSPDGTLLVSASEDGAIRWWDTATGELHGQADDWERIGCLAVAPDGKIATGNDGGVVRLWNLTTGRATASMQGHLGPVYSLAFTPDGRTLCSAGEDKTIRLWQAATGRPMMLLEGHAVRVNSVAFTPDGRTLASAGHDGTIKVWDGAMATPSMSR